MKKLAQLIFPGLLLGLLCGSISPLMAQQSTIHETYSSVSKITLNLALGDVQLSESTSGKVDLSGDYDSDQMDVRITLDNGHLKIEEKSKRKNQNDSRSSYALMVPAGLDVKVNTGTGDINLQDVNAEIDVNTGTGEIRLKGFDGVANLNTGTGNIAAEKSSGKINLNSGTGDVSLSQVKGSLSANSGTGDVHAKGISPDDKAAFNSGTGDVRLSLEGPVTADMSVNSGTGKASLDFNGQPFDGTLIMVCHEKSGSIASNFDFDRVETQHKNLVKTKKFGNADVKLKVTTGTGQAKVTK